MDNKKIAIVILIVILLISNYFMLYGESYLGEYVKIFAMLAILSGVSAGILVIINGRQRSMKSNDLIKEFDIFNEQVIEKKLCNVCHTENKTDATFCKSCASDLRDIICPVCTTVNPYDQKYCTECESVLRNEKRH